MRDSKAEDEGLKDLVDSIKENTLINKIILRPGKNGKYEIIAGQRRYKALVELLGAESELPPEDYVLEELNDEKAVLLSITENQYRLGLTPVELNRAILKLNSMGYKDKDITKLLNISASRMKRLSTLAQDIKRMPEAAQKELHKPVEESKFNDGHLDKVKGIENDDIIKDVVDFIIDKEAPPRDVPTIVKAIEKQYEKDNPPLGDEDTKPSTHLDNQPPAEGPIEYAHKGELVLEIHDNEKILKVLGKGSENESEVVPVDHYMEYLMHPEKFRCYVSFKLKIKPVD
jgi:ParB/RepB/Spo0J family partition protein